MAEPLAIVGGVGSILQIITSVTKLAKNLNEVRESYDNVALNTTLVASQLSTIRAALEALHTWRASDTVETEASKQLDQDLGLSLSCCAILISVIDGKLAESGYRPGVGMKQKIKYVWLEDILKEYVSNLEGQVRALQLLLTIFQCRTATEQKQQLAKAESRSIIEQIRAETMSLSVGDTEMDDAMSILSHDPSVHLDVDSILMKSPAYVRVYGEVRVSHNASSSAIANQSATQRDSPRRRKGSKPPPPPPPRRKPQPQSAAPPPALEAESVLSSPGVKPLPQPPPEAASQSSLSPSGLALYSPPLPPRPKARSQPRKAAVGTHSEKQQPSQGRINVWDFLGPGQENKVHDASAMAMADSAQVFELSAAAEPVTMVEEHKPDSQVPNDATASLSSKDQTEENRPDLVRRELPEPNVESAMIEKTNAHKSQDPALTEHSSNENGITPSERPTSLEGFRTQIDVAFEENRSSDTVMKDLRLSLGLHKISSAPSPCGEAVTLTQEEPAAHDIIKASTDEGLESVHNDTSEAIGNAMPTVRKTLSIHSDVDLYEASVRDLPVKEISRPLSPSSVRHETLETENLTPVDDEVEAEMEGLSVLNQQLAAKHINTQISNDSASSTSTRAQVPEQSGDAEKPAEDQTEERKPIVTPSSEVCLSPQIAMAPSLGDVEILATKTASPIAKAIESPISPSRAPPLPPTLATSITAIPVSSPPLFDPETRISGFETSTTSSGRDSSVFEASSTISSSEQSVDNTISSLQQSTSNTTATSIGINGAALAREQAQSDLRRLQSELTAAKDRGDSQAFQDSVQKSIEVIRRTYLAASTPPETNKSSSLRERASFKRFSSLTGSSNRSALCDAAAGGNLTSLKALLNARVNVDTRGKAFMTPLMLAAINGHTECMAILRQHGADEFAVDAKGRSVLHLAVASSRAPVVQWLLSAYEYPPPRRQALKHRPSILSRATESLITRFPKDLRETSDSEGSKPIHVSVEADRGDSLEILLAAGVDIESKNNWGRTPLHQAIISGRRDSFNVLLRNGANINTVDARSMSPLHWAAKTGHADMLKSLLAKGADRHDFDKEGNQPIHEAAWAGKVSCIEAVITERKDLEVPTKAGESLLHIACLNKNSELMIYLLSNNIEVNPWAVPQRLWNAVSKFKVPLSSLTPLHYACCKGDLERAMQLLDHEAWINAATPEGVTALMMAAESEDTNTVNLLLSRGAKVNASMPGTLLTALHIASRRGDLETVQQLCRAGANRHARTHGGGGTYGRTPLEETMAKCADKVKKAAVEEYFRTIRQNELKNARVRSLGQQRQSSDTVGHGYRAGPSLDIRPAEPISYAPWGQHEVIPMQQGQYGYQQQMPAPYPVYMQPMQMQMPAQWYDPDSLNHVESPPPYQPGSNVSARLATQAAVHRPSDNPRS